ncbi:MAG: hypothetical protein ABR499_08675 [Gemmatimonadaceae bacterium]
MPMNLDSRAVRILIATLVGVVAALAVPLGNLWLKCQQPASEACVWSRAYLPLSLGLTAVILGVPVFVVTLVLLRRYAATRVR